MARGGGGAASGRDTGGAGGASRSGRDNSSNRGGAGPSSRGGVSQADGDAKNRGALGGSGRGGTSPDSARGSGLGGLLDTLFGYDNIGQRKEAFSNNPSWSGNQRQTGMIPSFPNAPIGYGLAALASAPMGPVGFGTRIADIATGGSGHGMLADAMSKAGYGPGPRGPDVPGGGKERGGQGGALNGQGLLGLPNPAQSPGLLSGTPTGTSAPQPQTPSSGLLTMEYPGQTVPIGGPTPYSYYRPPYNYYGR